MGKMEHPFACPRAYSFQLLEAAGAAPYPHHPTSWLLTSYSWHELSGKRLGIICELQYAHCSGQNSVCFWWSHVVLSVSSTCTLLMVLQGPLKKKKKIKPNLNPKKRRTSSIFQRQHVELRQNFPPKFVQPRSREKPSLVEGTKKESEPTIKGVKSKVDTPKNIPQTVSTKGSLRTRCPWVQDEREADVPSLLLCFFFFF